MKSGRAIRDPCGKACVGRAPRRKEGMRMQHQVAVCLLGDITVRVDDDAPVRLTAKSRIGASLMEYLIMQRGQPVSGARLIRELWKDRPGRNPENALKTMISRLRSLLHGICVGLGDCVANGASGYYWQTLPWVQVDVLDLMDCIDRLRQRPPEAEKRELLERIMVEYTDDLYNSGDISNGIAMVNYLHKEYLDAACALVEMMRAEKAWGEICRVCRRALEIDSTDRQLRAEMADAAEWLERGERRRGDRRDGRQDADENEEILSARTETGRQRTGSVMGRSSAITRYSRKSTTSRCATWSAWAPPCSWA